MRMRKIVNVSWWHRCNNRPRKWGSRYPGSKLFLKFVPDSKKSQISKSLEGMGEGGQAGNGSAFSEICSKVQKKPEKSQFC